MAKKDTLRELQSRLAERLQAARTHVPSMSWLAVECGGRGVLFPLQQAGEIFPLVPVVPVPHTQPWFTGVANLRGGLHGVVDFAAFLHLRPAGGSEPLRDQQRLVAFNPSSGLNCALLIDRLAGLRSADQLVAEPVDGAAPRPAFAGGVWRDRDGGRWQEILLSTLALDEHFLAIVG